MITVTKTQKSIVAVFSLLMVMTIGPMASNIGNVAYAEDNWWDRYFDFGDDNGNSGSSQSISQEQDSEQESQASSGDDTEFSGNNFSFQEQDNEGNNVSAENN